MLPKINGKSFLECTEDDLINLIDNPDFRESEYIDYKQTFAFLELPKGREKNEKISEFRSDVCSFANANGGFLKGKPGDYMIQSMIKSTYIWEKIL